MSGARQFEHLQRATLERLRAHVPDGVPLRVERVAEPVRMGFIVTGPGCECSGRAHVVGSFIDGFVAGWRERGNDIGG